MSAACLPSDEENRKRVLDSLGVLDTLPESFSDAIAVAAAALAGVPVSAISLVDTDRQWFKGSCGLDNRETSRDVSFCAHAILATEPFIVPDAAADARFRDNPLVAGAPHIRFYAGFPLIVDGHGVGSLCVIDTQPRALARDVVERLTVLAAGTSSWLNDRRSLLALLRRSEEALHHARFHDDVTGLPNRRLFDDSLDLAVRKCAIEAQSVAVLFIELDGFKATQALWGRVDAQDAIQEVGRRLRAAVRSTDLVAHCGGDQFLVLATGGSGGDAARRISDQVSFALRPLVETTHHRARFTASIGAALHPADGPVDQLIANANAAMASVTQAGGNGFRFFRAEMNAEALLTMGLVEDLRAAIEKEEFELHYQPKVDAISGRTTGVEALLRWSRPGHAPIGPAVFVPIAESAGLIGRLGSWVISAACRQMQAWCAAGVPVRVSINLSVVQLRRPELGEEIARELAHCGVEPSLLTCEVTESVAMDDAVTSLATFELLRASGVHLSIDDFGTGYSSLSYLRKLPVSELKIDRSFVTDLGASDDAKAVVAAIIQLAHALRLEVVAEGVETAVQRDILRDLGCDSFQGYLFAKPMTAERFTWLTLDRKRQESDLAGLAPAWVGLALNGA